jgi:two-component system sensor histidine kinase HydH
MKHVNRRASLFAALIGWILLSALAVFIIWVQRDRARLIRDNENERILNTLFTSLRDYDDFGPAIAENETLRQRITGFAVYDSGRALVQRWGKVPSMFDLSLIGNKTARRFNRYTIPDRRSGSVTFVIHNDKPPVEQNHHAGPQSKDGPPAEVPGMFPGSRQPARPAWFNAFSGGNYVHQRKPPGVLADGNRYRYTVSAFGTGAFNPGPGHTRPLCTKP